jgi:hypothetical protein
LPIVERTQAKASRNLIETVRSGQMRTFSTQDGDVIDEAITGAFLRLNKCFKPSCVGLQDVKTTSAHKNCGG